MKNLKTLVAISLVLVLVFSMPAFAKEQYSADLAVANPVSLSDAQVEVEEVSPRTVIIGSKGGTISGAYGEVELFLGKDVSYGMIKAGIAFSQTSGNVNCMVKYPNGAMQHLGVLSITTGAETPLAPGYYLKAGTYTFTFEASTLDSFDVLCTIYE